MCSPTMLPTSTGIAKPAHMAAELFDTKWIKLEVIRDDDTLQPDIFGLAALPRDTPVEVVELPVEVEPLPLEPVEAPPPPLDEVGRGEGVGVLVVVVDGDGWGVGEPKVVIAANVVTAPAVVSGDVLMTVVEPVPELLLPVVELPLVELPPSAIVVVPWAAASVKSAWTVLAMVPVAAVAVR